MKARANLVADSLRDPNGNLSDESVTHYYGSRDSMRGLDVWL